MSNGSSRVLVLLLGAGALAGQAAWSRIAVAAVGGTFEAAALTLSAAMAGLSIGAGAIWRKASLAAIVAGAGVSLAFIPPLLLLVSGIEGPPAFRVVLVGLLLVAANLPFGALLPAVTSRRGSGGGELYALGSAGAVAGALAFGALAPFVALDHLGLLMGAGIVLASLFFRRPGAPSGRTEPGRAPWTVLGAAFATGLLGLVTESLWLSVLGFSWESSARTFAWVTAATVGGLAAGSLVASRLSSTGRTGPVVGLVLSAFTLSAAAAIAPQLIHATSTVSRIGLTFFLVGVPASMAGATFVLLLRSLGGEAGRSIGRLSAANGAGAAAGPLLLWILGPWLPWPAQLLAFLACGYALLTVVLAPRAAPLAALLAGVLGIWGWVLPSAPSLDAYHPEASTTADLGAVVMPYVRSGVGSTVAVTRDTRTGLEVLWIDRGFQGDTSPLGRRIPQALGRLPGELLGRPARRAAVIGLGTGMTLSAVRAESVDVAELCGGVIEANRTLLAEINGGALARPGVTVRRQDGRTLLADAGAPYDLIVTDMIFPSVVGAGNLFSREFYALARRRLERDGLFVHWVPVFQLSPPDLSATVAGFLESFPEGSAWVGFLGTEKLVLGLAGGAIAPKLAPEAARRRALGPGELRELAGGTAPIRDGDPRLEFRSLRGAGGGLGRVLTLMGPERVAEAGAADGEFLRETATHELHLATAQAAAARGDERGWMAGLRRAAAHPVFSAGNQCLADALAARGLWGEALTECERAAAKAPRSADVRLKLAMLACSVGDRAKARQAYEAACALRPDRPPLYLELAKEIAP